MAVPTGPVYSEPLQVLAAFQPNLQHILVCVKVPNYVKERVRRAPPSDVPVVSGAPPVVCFGDVEQAKVATLGLNPSDKEYLDNNGDELSGDQRRFETVKSLEIESLDGASDEAIQKVYQRCIRYFENNPYSRWFDELDEILNGIGASYYDGSAVHLDLVQWATPEKWGNLSAGEKEALLESDVPFLREQLDRGDYRQLLLNGRQVMDEFSDQFDTSLSVVEKVDRSSSTSKVEICQGTLPMGTEVIGWSTNLQSTWGLANETKETISKRVRELTTG
jgi:hypothetical protein